MVRNCHARRYPLQEERLLWRLTSETRALYSQKSKPYSRSSTQKTHNAQALRGTPGLSLQTDLPTIGDEDGTQKTHNVQAQVLRGMPTHSPAS